MAALRGTLSFSLRIVSFITIPAMVGLMILRQPIIQVLFQHGRFDEHSTRITAWALLFFSLGLPWFAATKIIVPAFYSTQDTRTPVKVAVVVMAANVLFNVMFLEPLRNWRSRGGHSASQLAELRPVVQDFRAPPRRPGPPCYPAFRGQGVGGLRGHGVGLLGPAAGLRL